MSIECGHRWEPDRLDNVRGTHVCVKPPSHVHDITDDDHRCCCGANTWETP